MTELSACGEIRLSLGVYVVGAIDPAERSAVDKHLTQCPDCRAELAGLAGLPALLGRVPASDVERLADGAWPAQPPPELLDSLLRRINVRRKVRKWRALTAVAAVAVLAVGGGLAGGVAISSAFGSGPGTSNSAAPPPGPPAVVMPQRYETERHTDPRTHVTALVGYYSANWGTSVRVQVSGVPLGTTCEFWAVDKHGRWWLGSSWTERAGDQRQMYRGSLAVDGAAIAKFVITSGRRPLVTVPAT